MTSTNRTHKANGTRRQLLAAAVSVIGEKGYSGATVDEIVEVAGVSKGIAYYHFKSKAAMASNVLEEGIGSLVDEFDQLAENATGASTALLGMIEAFATRIFENKAFGRFFVSELWREGRVWSEEMRTYEQRLLHILEGQISRGQKEGYFRPEIDPAFEAVAIVGMVLTTSLYYITEDGILPGKKIGVCADEMLTDGRYARGEKDAFIGHISDFVRHATVQPPLLG
ncbi:MAG: TetR/AcrR family transcriptional regulator [Raoultibacter sp.]